MVFFVVEDFINLFYYFECGDFIPFAAFCNIFNNKKGKTWASKAAYSNISRKSGRIRQSAF